MKTFPLQERLAILREINLRNDMSAAELRICWFLLIDRTNESGDCHCSNNHLAEALDLDPSTVKRAKQNLRNKHILTWPNTGKLGASTHLATEYRFFLQVRGRVHAPSFSASTPLALGAPTHLGLGAPTHPDQNQNLQLADLSETGIARARKQIAAEIAQLRRTPRYGQSTVLASPQLKTNNTERDKLLGFIVPTGETGFRHKVETGEWQHWDAYSKKTRGKPAPSVNGGWTFRYQHPNEAIA